MKIGQVMHKLEFVIHARKLYEASPDAKRDMIRSWIEEKTFGDRITSEIHENYINEGVINVDGIINLLLNYAGYLVYDDTQEAITDLYMYNLSELKKIMLGDQSIILLDMNVPKILNILIPVVQHLSIGSYLKTFIGIIRFGKIRGAFSFLWKEFPRIFITDNRVKEKHTSCIGKHFRDVIISREDALYK